MKSNWWTADEAKENGFVDEVDDAEEDAVVENRNGILFVNSVGTHLPFNEAPEFVRNRQRLNRPPSGLKITTRRNRRNTTTMGR